MGGVMVGVMGRLMVGVMVGVMGGVMVGVRAGFMITVKCQLNKEQVLRNVWYTGMFVLLFECECVCVCKSMVVRECVRV